MSRVDEALNRARGNVRVISGTHSRNDINAFTREDAADTGIGVYPVEQQNRSERAKATPRDVPPPPLKPVVVAPSPSLLPVEAEVETGMFAQPMCRFNEAVRSKVVIGRDTSRVSVEQYRRLAATLHGLHVSAGLRTIMVSSALPRDGKTLTTTNLALTLSDSYGQRVLLIDADLRRPSIHDVFRLDNRVGLADGLRAGATGSLPVMEVSTTLTVLTAGTPDHRPMAGLTSERMASIVKEAASRFDWVLIDTPPIGLISDGQLLSSLVDGVVLVVGAGSTDYAAVSKTVDQIGRDRIIGVVLNRVEHAPTSGGYYQDYYVRSNDYVSRDER
jgi:protein-tyrosine kinase